MDQLNRGPGSTVPAFRAALAHAALAGGEVNLAVPYSFTDRLLVKALSPGAKFKLPVPRFFAPSAADVDGFEAVRKLDGNLSAFSAVLVSANEKRLQRLRVTSAANDKFRPSIVAYLDVLVPHNRYHWLQIGALLMDPRFPSA